MSGQALDLRRSAHIVRRYKVLVGVFAVLGLVVGAGYAMLNPPMLTSNALVVLPISNRAMATDVVIARSDPVLSGALPAAGHGLSLDTLRNRIQVKSLTGNVLSISGQGETAAEAEEATNALANSFIRYIGSGSSAVGALRTRLLAPANSATGSSVPMHLAVMGGIGALLGALVGAIVALALARRDRRLRARDEIADTVGVPVVASIAAGHPSDPAGWTKLVEEYEPGAINAWSLRRALNHLGLIDLDLMGPVAGSGSSIAVLSFASDRTSLAIGPQLAVFATSLGTPTALIIGPQQDENATASLRAACNGLSAQPSVRGGSLRIAVADHAETVETRPGELSVIVAVVDGQAPKVTETMRGAVTVLGVSAGAATAEQLARVAVSAAASGRHITGIIVTDPDPADHTTGRLPQPTRRPGRRQPTRFTGTTTETRR